MVDDKLVSPLDDANAGIRPAKLAHVVLRSNENFEGVVSWYENLLNAKLVHKDPMSAFMTYDDEHHRLAVLRGPTLAERPYGTVGLEHFAFTYATLEDLLGTYERLKEQEINPVVTINHGATTSIYYEDPDRNRVELQVDNYDSFGEFVQFLETGAMKDNPIGVEFDADQMVADLKSGVSASELKAYKRGPMSFELMGKMMKN